MDRREARGRRLYSQLLWAPTAADPAAIVGHFLAMQAQEYLPSQWSIAQRTTPPPDAATLSAAIDRGDILRTHVLRPTWHYVTPADARWLLELTGPRIRRLVVGQYRSLGMSDADLDRASQLIAERVSSGEHLIRAQLAETLSAAGLPSTGIGLSDAVMAAELDRHIISGASQGKQRSYAAFDSRVPPARNPFGRDVALADLAARYLTARGPATARDLALWSGLSLTDARRGVRLAVERAPEAFIEVAIEELTHWMPRAAYESLIPDPASPRVDLLQAYDEYVMGYTESRGYFAPPGYQAPTVPTRLSHHVFIDGMLRGSWGHAIAAKKAGVTVRPFAPLTERERAAVASAAAGYAEFHALPLELLWEEPGA